MRSHTIMSGRAVRLSAAFAIALAVSTIGPAVASAATGSGLTATSCTIPRGDITWRNNHNGRYLEVYHSETTPGDNVDSYPWNCTRTQMWVPVLDGVEYFNLPVQGSGSYDAWSFYNQNNGLCIQDPSGTPDVRVYSEPCAYGDEQEFAEYPTTGGYYLIANWGQEICERYSGSIDWAIEVANGYPDYNSDKCIWH